MADVRSLLRNERAQRRVNHPLASYTPTGTLECTVCHIPLKSDQEVWAKHLKSTQHAMRQERLRLSTSKPAQVIPPRGPSTGSKKRKADDGGDVSRKKTKPIIEVPGGLLDNEIKFTKADDASSAKDTAPSGPLNEPIHPTLTSSTLPSHPMHPPSTTTHSTIDENEWAAFERDVATPPPDPSHPSAFTAEATISAAPLTAAELAAQSREQASQQTKERRDAEVEGEKEDAARALEEEFDEMEDLEERVARLRKMREELRMRRANVADEKKGDVDELLNDTGGGDRDEVDDSDDDEDDSFGWGGLGK